MSDFGLGAIQSPPDPRDYQVAALYASVGITRPAAAIALPSRFLASPMPPVLNQRTTPQCVAYSNASEQMAFDIHDQKGWFNFDKPRFFRAIGGTAGGAVLRDALEQRRKVGYDTVGHNDAALHKITAYYAVPKTVLAIKQAIFTFGPLVLATPWAQSWFTPAANGMLPAPSGGDAGGHAIEAWGWDNRLGLLLRNSWGAGWGVNGNAYLPFKYATGTVWEYWKAIDAIEKP